MKLIKKIKDYFKHRVVYVHDKYYDFMTNNDKYGDIPTIVEVIYSRFRGIISVKHTNRLRESDLIDREHFYIDCGIYKSGGPVKDYSKYSIYNRL